ncbi:hypothetical protein BHE74_00055233 [Ensete ventricosum]|nr:hypothetical protein BHE74_00055233 [Ensete ventricosum]
MVRTGPLVDRNADCSLSGGTIDWGCFRLVTIRNRSIMVDFDCRRPLSEEEGEKKGEPGVWRCSPDPFFVRAICRPRDRLWAISSPTLGEETSPRMRRNEATLKPGLVIRVSWFNRTAVAALRRHRCRRHRCCCYCSRSRSGQLVASFLLLSAASFRSRSAPRLVSTHLYC